MTQRRNARFAFSLALGVSLASLCAATARAELPNPSPVVSIASGQVQGTTLASGVYSFLGIPYAAPPVGPLRWKRPQPPASWTGVRQATAYSNYCPQGLGSLTVNGGNEDCLYLNVQTPTNFSPSSKLPVMLWIHGGGLQYGSGQEYDGTPLVQQGVVFVSINYRLGLLGFLALPQLRAEEQAASLTPARSGNYGMLDQVAAIAWVRNNIAAFGGDPNKIMLFGELAGGSSTIAQLVTPLRGNFRAAAIQSGGYAQTYPTATTAEAAGTANLATLGCDTASDVLACLRAIPSATLITKSNSLAARGSTGPNIDGYFLTRQPFDAVRTGDFAHVPLINGTNRTEGTLFISQGDIANVFSNKGPVYTPDNLTAALEGLNPGTAALYPLANYPNANYAYAAASTDVTFSCPAVILNGYASQYTPVYSYELNDPNWPNHVLPADPYLPSLGTPHSADLSFLFPSWHTTLLKLPPTASFFTVGEQRLAASMRSAWVNMAKYGRPLVPRGAAWPAYGSAANIMNLTPPGPSLNKDFVSFHQCSTWIPFLLSQAGLPSAR